VPEIIDVQIAIVIKVGYFAMRFDVASWRGFRGALALRDRFRPEWIE
jgi:hypothetical protein